MSIIQSLRRKAKPTARPAAGETKSTRLGRQVYATALSRLQLAIGSTLRENRERIRAIAGRDTKTIRMFVSKVIGDALTDVIDTSEEDLDQIAENLNEPGVAGEEPIMGADDEEPPVEEPQAASDDEEPSLIEDEPEAAADEEPEAEEPDEDETEAIAAELSKVKAKILAQAKRLAKSAPDAAAKLDVLASRL
jgi:hypothetical protein